ncbi:glycosyltransferase family 4 protein [Flavitalea sp. BT771]|uniref:glycosyltransferase family 4 protein n=1 Tax=Flavitalea sp. BT771 TaxID=3063329 RepID=UPI0026E1DA79|nr:glycosyltransferase family 4 protein [Flavitalea sp. BT771]MDO6435545.1 glycosyltransferase family 4 protein [Flavitalea sp. BT771]MDV6224445.1 glycosyltransferase family 4 protein [Flavitalea sp. BT771]
MKRSLLCIVHLPPPVHGASLMNQHFVDSALINDHYRLKVIDITTSRDIGKIGHMSLTKIFDSLRLFFRILSGLIRHRPDLVYFTFSPSGFAFYRDAAYVGLVKLLGGKLLFHLHGKGIAAGAGNSTLFRWVARRVFSHTHVIVLSQQLTNDLKGMTYKEKFILPYGIPVELTTAVERVPNPGAVRLLFLSNYVRSKGIIDLIDALEKVAATHRNFHLRLVGKPYDVSIEELNDHIRQKKLNDLITVCGPRYKEEKLEELRQADLFVFPTYYPNEAFPLVLLEAMQWGLPIVTTREGGIPDMIEEGVSGLLIDQRDISALADKILLLLEDPAKRIAMGAAARERFMTKFTLPRFEQDMLKILDIIR